MIFETYTILNSKKIQKFQKKMSQDALVLYLKRLVDVQCPNATDTQKKVKMNMCARILGSRISAPTRDLFAVTFFFRFLFSRVRYSNRILSPSDMS